MTVPFRWNVAKREQLGSFVHGEPAWSYENFLDDLQIGCGRVVALAGDARLVFVGRSPESLFDYLSGALAETSWEPRLSLMNVSLKGYRTGGDDARSAELRPLWEHLTALGLEPATIAASPVPIALIDLVYQAETLGRLAELLLVWAESAGVDPEAVRRRLRFVGLTERTKNSPNTWRWQQQVAWARDYKPAQLKSVSIPYRLWAYLGNFQAKVSETNPPHRWGLRELTRPPRKGEHVQALRLALAIHEHATDPDERERFATLLAGQPEMKNAWLRDLVLELRGKTRK